MALSADGAAWAAKTEEATRAFLKQVTKVPSSVFPHSLGRTQPAVALTGQAFIRPKFRPEPMWSVINSVQGELKENDATSTSEPPSWAATVSAFREP